MGSDYEHWQPLAEHPQKSADDYGRLRKYGLLIVKLMQITLACGTAVDFGRAVAIASTTMRICANECVLADNLNVNATDYLVLLLAIYAVAFVGAMVVMGASLYHATRLTLDKPAPSCSLQCKCSVGAGASDTCTCPAGQCHERSMLASTTVMALLTVAMVVVRMWMLPVDFWLQCVVDAVLLSALNVTALHINLKAEQNVAETWMNDEQQLMDNKQQFILSAV